MVFRLFICKNAIYTLNHLKKNTKKKNMASHRAGLELRKIIPMCKLKVGNWDYYSGIGKEKKNHLGLKTLFSTCNVKIT